MEFIDVPLTLKTDELVDGSLLSEIKIIPTGERIFKLLHSTADFLKKLTNSDGCILYSHDEALGELYICPLDSANEECLDNRYRWSIERGDSIAVFAFKQMTPIKVDVTNSVDLNFPYLQALPSIYPRFIVSIPLVNFQKRCFGVVEYYRDYGQQYTETDVKLCQFLLQNCAEALKQNENAIFFKKFNKVQLQLQELLEIHSFVDYNEGSYRFLNEVVEMARYCTGALSSSLFFEKKGEIRKIVTTDENYNFPLQEDSQNEQGVIVRSIASADFNIKQMGRNIHGIIKVFNKIGLVKFSILDEQILEAFAKMCTIWCVIEYSSGYLRKQKSLNENILRLINIQLQNAGDFGKKLGIIVSSNLKMLNSWHYKLNPSPEIKQLLSDALEMINRVKGQVPIPNEALRIFVVMVEQCHRSDEEVDFPNTVLRLQGLYRLLGGCKGVAFEIEAFAMMIASLCHNIAVIDVPKPMSSIFGRYNFSANELIKFEVVQFLIQETQLLSKCNTNDQSHILEMIKEFMINMNLQCLKLNIANFSKIIQEVDITKLELERDPKLRSLIQAIIPGIGNILGHFKSELFQKCFPNFFLFKYLEENKLTCIQIIMAISPV